MKNFDVTIAYKAVLEVSVKANSEEEAKEKAMDYFTNKERKNWYNTSKASLTDDSYKAVGVVNQDESFGMLYADD